MLNFLRGCMTGTIRKVEDEQVSRSGVQGKYIAPAKQNNYAPMSVMELGM